MKFNEYKYERPNLEEVINELQEVNQLIGEGNDLQTEIGAVYKMFSIGDKIGTQGVLVSIRNSVDTTDAFYEAEQEFFDENGPNLTQYDHIFLQKLLTSKHRKELEKEFGKLMFLRAELAQKTFKPEIISDLQLENKLTTEYGKLVASAKIEFQGGTYNLSQMAPFLQNLDREVRHQAQLAVSGFFSANETQFDRIYDDMVRTRHEIAKKLGYENFVQLGYDRFGRTDYNAADVKTYRDQIYEDIVPLVTELTERKAVRLGIKNPKSYDLALSFLTGNPTPKGDRAWQVERAKKMYDEMSPATSEFFNFMLDHDLLDLDSKPGKQGGGYCTYLPEYAMQSG